MAWIWFKQVDSTQAVFEWVPEKLNAKNTKKLDKVQRM